MITENIKQENSKRNDEYMVHILDFIINPKDNGVPVYGEFQVETDGERLREATPVVTYYKGEDQETLNFIFSNELNSLLRMLYENRLMWNGAWDTYIKGYHVRVCKWNPKEED